MRAQSRTHEEFFGEAKARLFEELKPFLCGETGLPGEVAARLDIPIGTLRSHPADEMRYAELLRQQSSPIGSADDVDEELRRFRKIFTTNAQA